MRVCLLGVGSRGDVQPMLALAVGLRRRGHEVVLGSSSQYGAEAARLGVGFYDMGKSIDEVVREHGDAVFNPLAFARIARRLGREQAEHVVAAVKGSNADVVVAGALAFAAPTAATIVGAKMFWAALAPSTFPTTTVPHPLSGMKPRGALANRLTHTVINGVLVRALLSMVNPVRRAHGLAALGGYDDAVLGIDTLYAVDDAFARAPADWRVRAHSTGFWFLDDDTPLPQDVAAFVDAGDAPVYVGFGSMPVKDARERTQTIVDAVVRSGRRALLSTGWAGLGDVDLPPQVMRVGHVNHRLLFPRCVAVAHHCGAGTTAATARAGVPHIAVPHAFDQPTWAHDLRRLGVAAAVLDRGFDVGEFAGAIGRAVSDEEVRGRAAELGNALRETRGTDAAVDVIEASVDGAAAPH